MCISQNKKPKHPAFSFLASSDRLLLLSLLYGFTTLFLCRLLKANLCLPSVSSCRERSLRWDHHALCSGSGTGSACVSVPGFALLGWTCHYTKSLSSPAMSPHRGCRAAERQRTRTSRYALCRKRNPSRLPRSFCCAEVCITWLLLLWIQPVYCSYTCGIQALSRKSHKPQAMNSQQNRVSFHFLLWPKAGQIRSKPEDNFKTFLWSQSDPLGTAGHGSSNHPLYKSLTGCFVMCAYFFPLAVALRHIFDVCFGIRAILNRSRRENRGQWVIYIGWFTAQTPAVVSQNGQKWNSASLSAAKKESFPQRAQEEVVL